MVESVPEIPVLALLQVGNTTSGRRIYLHQKSKNDKRS